MQEQTPPIKVYESITSKKELKKLNKRYRSIDRDIKPLIEQLEAGATPGDRIVDNEYPVYKVRVPNSDTRKGKSSGYRVIYYTITPEAILLITIYSKSDKNNISNKEAEDIIDRYELEFDRQEKEIVTVNPENVDSSIDLGEE
jgi:mRNA-degrading endonuclease RelE of RelBE toxin-antitoxin system